MNIVHSGDHVVLAIPTGVSGGRAEQFQQQISAIADNLKDAPVDFRLTTLPIGAVDSSPYVLFIIRKP